jgi:thiol-disulfide isomerase/thioredoxin
MNFMKRALAVALAAWAAPSCDRTPRGATIPPLQFAQSVPDLAKRLKPTGKPLVINHWATWCGPCVDELPYFAGLAKQFEGKVDFVGVAWDNLSGDEAQESIVRRVDRVRAKCGVGFVTIVAPPGIAEVAKGLDLMGESIPQTFLVAPNGERLWKFQGEIEGESDKQQFEAAIRAAIR